MDDTGDELVTDINGHTEVPALDNERNNYYFPKFLQIKTNFSPQVVISYNYTAYPSEKSRNDFYRPCDIPAWSSGYSSKKEYF